MDNNVHLNPQGRIFAMAVLLFLVSMIIMFPRHVFAQDRPDLTVQRAFQLRIDGKVDEARTLLEEYVVREPDNALAHYELARIYTYMLTGDPGKMSSAIGNADDAISKAVAIEPDDPAFRYFAAEIQFLKSYMALQSDEKNAKEHIGEIRRAYESLLEIMPDNAVVLMNLVELYGVMPAEMGGDPSKAAEYASRLAGADDLLACMAHCIIMPEDFDRVGFWEGMLKKKPSDAGVLEELGKTCMREGLTEKGTDCLEKAMEADPSRTILLLEIARHQIMKSWQDPSIKEKATSKAIVAVNRFLSTEPIVPLKAYALGLLARLNYSRGDRSEGDKWSREAESLDPYFSKASAIPSADLFEPPGVMTYHHSYMFRPL